jgi:probable O-glycosylation ligase (exosortase A-associated)
MALQLSLWVGAYLLLRCLFSPEIWKWNWRVGLLFLFLAHNVLSLVSSSYQDAILNSFVNFAKSLVITYLIVCLTTTVARFRMVFLVIGISLGAEAAKQGWVGLLLHPGSPNENRIPFLGDNNSVAVGMLMLTTILVALSRTAASKRERWGFRLLGVGVLYRGLATYSRGGFLACAALSGVYIWRSKYFIRAVLSVVLLAAVVLPAMPQKFWNRMSTISLEPDEADRSATGRLHFWRVAVEMARANPFLGVGHNGYNFAYNSFDSSEGAYGRNRSVHSIWFGTLAELGYPGLLLFMIVLAVHLRTVAQVRRAAQRAGRPDLVQYAFALEASAVVFMVGGTFLPIHYNEMAWHLFGLGIALRSIAAKEGEVLVSAPTVVFSATHSGQQTTPRAR